MAPDILALKRSLLSYHMAWVPLCILYRYGAKLEMELLYRHKAVKRGDYDGKA